MASAWSSVKLTREIVRRGIDLADLVFDLGLAESTSAALVLILNGDVSVNGRAHGPTLGTGDVSDAGWLRVRVGSRSERVRVSGAEDGRDTVTVNDGGAFHFGGEQLTPENCRSLILDRGEGQTKYVRIEWRDGTPGVWYRHGDGCGTLEIVEFADTHKVLGFSEIKVG